MHVVIRNIGEFHGKINTWMEAVKVAAAEAAMGLAHEAFEQILETAPQNSGDFVANTKVAVGHVLTEPFQQEVVGPIGQEMFQMGDTPAMIHARSKANWAPGKLGQSIFISSEATHDEAYAWKIEKDEVGLRPANEGAHHIYERAVRHTSRVFHEIGKVQLASLRKVGS